MVPDIRFPLARLKWQKQSHVNYFGTAIKDCRWLPRRLPAQRLGRLPLTITAGAGREPNCLTAVFLCYSPRGVGRMRSEERRVGQEGVRTCCARGWPYQ